MQPLGSASLSHAGRVWLVLFLLPLAWRPVELVDLESKCLEAPNVPTMMRCTRCASKKLPTEDDGLGADPLPKSTQFCLKWFQRLETHVSEFFFNMTFTSQADLMSVARLVTDEEMRSSRNLVKDCRKSDSHETNSSEEVEDNEECAETKVDGSKGTCASQLTESLKKLIPIMSTEAGKQSLPLCDDFEDYKEDGESEVAKLASETSTETALPKLKVLRDRQISNISFHSVSWGIDGRSTILTQRTMGYTVLSDWFSKNDCPNDLLFGDVQTSTTTYLPFHLIGDLTILKGSSTTQPGIFLRQVQGNLSRTSGNEDLHEMGDGCQIPVASFTASECKVKAVVEAEDSLHDTAGSGVVDETESERNESDIDILMSVEPEINEIEEVEVEVETNEDKKKIEQTGCTLSTEEFARLGMYFGVAPNSFVRHVLRHLTISPVYSFNSNKTDIVLSPGEFIEVIEQVANSSALPVYNHTIQQVCHSSSAGVWERVVAVGSASSASVWAEIGKTFLDYYNKTFSFYNKEGPLQVHLLFVDRQNFTVRVEKPLAAWQLILDWRVSQNDPLRATLSVDEMNQFISMYEPTSHILNATVRESEDELSYAVKWHLSAGPARLASLLNMGKDLLKTMFGRSADAAEGDGLFDLLANIATGSTKEEQRQGEELVTEELTSMVIAAWKKISAFSATGPEDADPAAGMDYTLQGARAVWDVLAWLALVEEKGEPAQKNGEFMADVGQFIDLISWYVEPVDCDQ